MTGTGKDQAALCALTDIGVATTDRTTGTLGAHVYGYDGFWLAVCVIQMQEGEPQPAGADQGKYLRLEDGLDLSREEVRFVKAKLSPSCF